MDRLPTEIALRDWRFGQAQAERLCAALLHVEAYEEVDPQSPLGGPDGLKDVLCEKGGIPWVAAASFPPTAQTFSDVKAKFLHDLEGVEKNDAKGIVFFVNQKLTPGERQELLDEARRVGAQAEIYHLERMRGVLDAPKGCGARLEFLRIPMTEEEQWSFWSAMNYDVVRKLLDNEKRFGGIEAKLDLIIERTTALGANLIAQRSSLEFGKDISLGAEMPTANLSLATLGWVHRIASEEDYLPPETRGRLRAVQVWIGPAGEDGRAMPPPDRVVYLISEFFSWWHTKHLELREQTKESIIEGLAQFHHRFLSIHPFLDANGRVARLLLDQAARELLNQGIGKEFIADAQNYLQSLKSADQGNMEPLRMLIAASLQ